jgi:autotransporter-associated beta strand protein
LSYGMDRNVGRIIDTLKDPNHDGDQSDSVYDNTIIMFMNDNGAPSDEGSNSPFVGFKGTSWEGGIRVPFFIKMPGQTTKIVYDKPVTAFDVLPTFVAAAGGDPTQFATDGHNLLPQLTGQSSDNPNQVMFWRLQETWAVRKGDWKVTNAFGSNTNIWQYNLATSPVEDTAHIIFNGPVQIDLLREFTFWEATLEKPKWGAVGAHDQNDFDHFVFRTDLANPGTAVNWNAANVWARSDTLAPATMKTADGYANAIIEFPVRNDASYTATQNMTRLSRLEYMANQLQLTGNFTGQDNQSATLNAGSISPNPTGNSLGILFTKSLTGQMPQVRLDATSSGTAANFTYNVNFEFQLLNDLEITGDGTQNFVLNGALRDFYISWMASVKDPHNVLKTGTSQVTLAGNNQFGGTFTVNGGKAILAGPSAAITSGGLKVGSAGNFTLNSGTVTVPTLDLSSGGGFDFNGGTLKAVTVLGNLTNNGGTFSPGASPALSTISGNYVQNIGTLLMELGGTTPGTGFDRLLVSGMATVGSTLAVQLVNGFTPTLGQSFEILNATGGINGLFTSNSFPTLPGNFTWRVLYGANTVTLSIGPPGGPVIISPPGDYNQDGVVDAIDYTVWQDSFGSNTKLAADGNGNGVVDDGDYNVWRSHFGMVGSNGPGGGGIGGGTVPEPSTIALLLFGALPLAWVRRGRR